MPELIIIEVWLFCGLISLLLAESNFKWHITIAWKLFFVLVGTAGLIGNLFAIDMIKKQQL